MTRFFTCEQVKQRLLPKPRDFATATQDVRAVILANDFIVASTFFGSFVRANDQVSPMSDLDCLIVYNREHLADGEGLKKKLAKTIERDYAFPLDMSSLFLDDQGKSVIPPRKEELAGYNLAAQAGGLIKGEFPLKLETIVDTAQNMILAMEERMSWLELEGDEDEVEEMEHWSTIFNICIMLIRRMVDLKEPGFATFASKAQVVARYEVIAPEKCCDFTHDLMDYYEAYKQEVRKQMRSVSMSRYKQVRSTLLRHLQLGLAFIMNNRMWVDGTEPMIEGRHL
jgi:predicted nucleotidyltransferase